MRQMEVGLRRSMLWMLPPQQVLRLTELACDGALELSLTVRLICYSIILC